MLYVVRIASICSNDTDNGYSYFGSASVISTRVRVRNIKFIGNITFVSSALNELRTHTSNCDFSGLLTLPTICANIGGGGTQIFFNDCSFSGTGNTIIVPSASVYNLFYKLYIQRTDYHE